MNPLQTPGTRWWGGPQESLEGQYNTPLTPEEEQQFQLWAQQSGRIRDLADYDLRGAWRAGAAKGDGHLPDTYKKPNHPTFSAESAYSRIGLLGGQWSTEAERDTFTPSRQNMYNSPDGLLANYFSQVEPSALLKLMRGGK